MSAFAELMVRDGVTGDETTLDRQIFSADGVAGAEDKGCGFRKSNVGTGRASNAFLRAANVPFPSAPLIGPFADIGDVVTGSTGLPASTSVSRVSFTYFGRLSGQSASVGLGAFRHRRHREILVVSTDLLLPSANWYDV